MDIKPAGQYAPAVFVSVDPRVELIAIIQNLSRYRSVFSFLLNLESFPYQQDVTDWFSPYHQHPAITMFDEVSLQPRMFNFMAPPTTMLYLTEDLHPRGDVV